MRSAGPPFAIHRLTFDELRIPFRVAFRHASAERSATESVWVEAAARNGIVGRGESCPREYVTGETMESARAFFDRHARELQREIAELASVRTWAHAHREEIDRNPAAWCAIELALLEAIAQTGGQTVEAMLSLPAVEGRFTYTAVVGDSDVRAFHATVEQYVRKGFADFKVKLSGDIGRDREKLRILRELGAAVRVRVDANNLWESAAEAVRCLAAVDQELFAVEEPIRAGRYEELARIGESLATRIVLDESLARAEQVGRLPGAPGRWVINLRVSKMGGLLRSLEVLAAARAAGIGVIVGAQVGETSLLTRAGLTMAAAAGRALVAQEGAFGTFLLEYDVCDPPLVFGGAGVLDAAMYPSLKQAGFGLPPSRNAAANPS